MSKMLQRVLTVIPAAAVQALWILLLVKWLSPYAAYITLALSVAAVLLVLFIIIQRDETAYKILWLLVILTVPVAGAPLYLLRQQAHGTPAAKAPAARAGGRAAGSAPLRRDALRGGKAHGTDRPLAGA